jgi:hypothetical protein
MNKTFQYLFTIQYYSQFPKIIPDYRADYRRVAEQDAMTREDHRLAWLIRILIAATSCRINRYLAKSL